MSRSSIFNFESLEGFRPRVPLTLLGAMAVVLGLEAALRLCPLDTLMPADSAWGQLRFVEQAALPRAPRPSVLFLGSSRVRDAAAPAVIESQCGWPDGSVSNLALGGGRIFDALLLLERHPELLDEKPLVVLGVDDWYFSSQGMPLGTLYELYAPLDERLRFEEPRRGMLASDWAFRSRLLLKLAPAALARALGWEQDKPGRLAVDATGRVVDLKDQRRVRDAASIERMTRDRAALHLGSYRPEPVFAEHLERLAVLVRERGARLLILQLPNRSLYREIRDKQFAQAYALHLELLKATAAKVNAPLLAYDRPEECGLRDELFMDYGHLRNAGAEAFSRFFAEVLKAQRD